MESCAICLEASDKLHRVCKTCHTLCHHECFHRWCIQDESLVLQDFQYQSLGNGLEEFTRQSSQCFVCRQRTLNVSWVMLWSTLLRNVTITFIGWVLNCALFASAVYVGTSTETDCFIFGLFGSSWTFATIAFIDQVIFVWKRIQVYKL